MKKLKIKTKKENKTEKKSSIYFVILFFFFTERTGKSELCLIFLGGVVKIK